MTFTASSLVIVRRLRDLKFISQVEYKYVYRELIEDFQDPPPRKISKGNSHNKGDIV